jgi:hypothetical protein
MPHLMDGTTYWLTLTNIGLGIATVLLIAVVLKEAFMDLRGHRRHR